MPVLIYGLLVLGAAWVGAGAIAADVIEGDGISQLDGPVLSWMLAERDPGRTAAMVVITHAGSTVGMMALAAIVTAWLAIRRRFADAMLLAATAIGASALVSLVKAAIGRERPPIDERLVDAANPSFPSGHALVSAAVVSVMIVIALRSARTWWQRSLVLAAALAPIMIGVSRVYLGVHWASDVLGGWLVGIGWAALCLCLLTRHPATNGTLGQ